MAVALTGAAARLLSAERQHPHARPSLVDRQERASLDVLPVRVERFCDDAHDHIGEQVLRSDLHDARPVENASSQNCREVEVVRDDDEVVFVCKRQDLDVRRSRSTDGGSVDSLEPVPRQPLDPAWRQVHVHEKLHGWRRGTSTPSARQAA
jgi:hypothetical protein